MSVRIAALLPAAVAALVLSLPAGAAEAAQCRPGHEQRVIARSAQAVLLARAEPAWGFRLWGCSRRSGARRLLATGDEGHDLETPLLRGTHVGYLDVSLDEPRSTVVSDDALRRGRRVAVGSVLTADRIGLRMGDGGALAWRDTVGPGQRLRLWRRGDTTRLVDEGFSLTGVRFTGASLRWRHAGADRAAPAPAESACSGRPGVGSTTTVDIIHTTTATVACWRATGAATTFATTTDALATTDAWVAVTMAGSIEVRNLLDPTAARSVPWLGSVAGLVVDGHGSLGWTFGNNVKSLEGR